MYINHIFLGLSFYGSCPHQIRINKFWQQLLPQLFGFTALAVAQFGHQDSQDVEQIQKVDLFNRIQFDQENSNSIKKETCQYNGQTRSFQEPVGWCRTVTPPAPAVPTRWGEKRRKIDWGLLGLQVNDVVAWNRVNSRRGFTWGGLIRRRRLSE